MILDWCRTCSALRDATYSAAAARVVSAVAPEFEPITLEEARWQLRVDTFGSPPESDDDPWLLNIGIPAARQWAEGYTGLVIAQQTLEVVLQAFPTYIELPVGPVRAVESITYLDADNVEQTLDPAEYTLDSDASPPRVYPVTAWPAIGTDRNPIRARYEAGYDLLGESPQGFPLPPNVRIGMLLMLADLYENRENATTANVQQVPSGARVFLDQIRVRYGFA